MLLINNLYGEYDSETPEGRGANAASNLMKYFAEGKKIASENAKKLVKGIITMDEACKNSAIEKFSRAYIPYTEINEESGEINLEYGMAFSTIYLNSLDRDNDGVLPAEELGPIGHIIDQIEPDGKITKSKFLSWLIFQDCINVYNGIISPQEAARAVIWAANDPVFVIEKLKEIYYRLNLKAREESFRSPEPVRG
ncbi:MAG: hypothetical protein A2Y25_04085 [Candidatus Melainabacteria bacterium GWF2_37_15]|nr:MAG: hypothetical protein A2Y25_04085 [Candidatus Melainabacteria bacterium GWF2_37_15]